SIADNGVGMTQDKIEKILSGDGIAVDPDKNLLYLILCHSDTVVSYGDINKISLSVCLKIDITPAQLALEPCSGAVVQTDVDNGQIIALVTYPSYDNNQLANKINWDYYKLLLDDNSNPLYNRATQQRTTTGSAIKMMTSAAGFMYDVIGADEKIKDLVVFTKVVPSPSCSSSSGHGNIDVSDAIKNSCNYFFYEVGYRLSTTKDTISDSDYSDSLGISRLQETGKYFGLTSVSGIEIGEASPEFSTADAVRSSIGYGYKFTPIQIARYATTVANKGTLYKNTLLEKIVNKDGEITYRSTPEVESKLTMLSNYEWDKIVYGMEKVITNSATLSGELYNVKVQVAGKTGTAQTSNATPPHSVFVSFAPSRNPETSIVCVIANGYSGQYSGLVATDAYRFYYNGEFAEYLKKAEEVR
ncbi:MAG: hypothetical protein K6B75_09220, partial [Lachnospiraceae bacterium]|nr:hypothetical protein [Lachnospiraceae bacterium]